LIHDIVHLISPHFLPLQFKEKIAYGKPFNDLDLFFGRIEEWYAQNVLKTRYCIYGVVVFFPLF